MRFVLTFVLMFLPVLASAQQQAPAAPKTEAAKPETAQEGALKTEKDKLSYAMGMDLGGQLKRNSVDIDPALFAEGLKAMLAGSKTLLTDAEAKAVISQLQMAMVAKQAGLAKAAGEKNKTEGEAFLAANKTKEGVVTLPSGVQYKVITNGTGPKPTLEQTVVCQYKGTLIDGKEFDSSYKRGQPATFPVKGVIKGWTEVLQLMPVGSKWQVFIPPALAYAERGAGADIGPNATLIFEIELVAIK
jgi:FKBP-type peptidyl-prolyl cis-trans isomerase FklB